MIFRFRLRFLGRSFSSSNVSTMVNSYPNPHSYTKPLSVTINKLFHERDPDKLAVGFIAASSSYRFRCRRRIYEIAIYRLANPSRPDSVESIIEAQKRFSSDFAREGFAVRLISLYGEVAMPTQATTTFHQLPSLGSPYSVKSFNALLTAYVYSADVDGLTVAFHDIPATDPSITLDLISYNILIGALCRKGDFDAALGTVDRMEKNGVPPCLITCNILFQAAYETKGSSEAEKICALMQKKNIKPDSKNFNAKLRWLVSSRKASEATELIDQMKRIGPKPDTFSFNALFKCYSKTGTWMRQRSCLQILPRRIGIDYRQLSLC